VLPATSANLGPAFDAAALAFSMFLKVKAAKGNKFSIVAAGRDERICGKVENHLILQTYREVLESEGRFVQPLALRIENQIPIGKGCGSSAAARLAGIVLAVHFGRLNWQESRIVGEASRREHHPDNAAACWTGGIAIAGTFKNGETQMATLRPKGKWPLLLVVPEDALSTERARGVLPEQYSRQDVVVNLQNSMLMFAAFSQGRPELLPAALEDRIHQPYRTSLCPLLPALQELKDREILGVALSGAGPSVLVFLNPRANETKTIRRVQAHLASKGLSAELLPAQITLRGARMKWSSR
jgi:homoserine kinase